jgi:hypothetical protein
MLSNSSPKGSFFLGLQPTQAWMAILGLVFFSALCILAGAGSILRLAFPVGSLAVGIFLYVRYPILYIGFTWWMWFLTPLLRRLVDYRSGWDQQGLILLAPFLVTLITFATFLRHLPKSYRIGGLPFVLAFTGVFYAFLVGLIQTSPALAARALLDWLTPILFGFHLLVNWRDYPSYRQNIQRTFLWGVFVMGVYGLLQYAVAPEWDMLWLVNSKMTTSAGAPVPFGFRVWSTLHSFGHLAVFLMAALLLLFNSQGPLRLPASAVGYLSFLLTSARSTWGGWLLGIFTLMISLKPHLQMRLVVTILVMVLCVFPLTTIEPFATAINSRFQSFSDLKNDGSANARGEIYSDTNLDLAFSNSLGNGIGGGGVTDSGILDIFFTLGWFGAIPYVGGMVLVLFELFQSSEARFDTFASASRAIALSVVWLLLFFSSMISFFGLFFWAFSGMGMAACKYYQHQRSA